MSHVRRTTTIIEELDTELGLDGPFEVYSAVRSARQAAGRIVSKETSYEFHTDVPECVADGENGDKQVTPATCRVYNHSDKER